MSAKVLMGHDQHGHGDQGHWRRVEFIDGTGRAQP